MKTNKGSVPHLVSAKWLARRLKDPDIRIIDARPTIIYLSGHIENAVSASFNSKEYMSYDVDISKGGGVDLFSDPKSYIANQDSPTEMIREVLGKKLGIRRDTLVVVYSDGADSLATRFWWTLEHIGHKKICILDGGFDKWLEMGLKAVNEETEVQPVEYESSEPDPSCLVDTDWVIKNLASPEIKMVFGLPFSNYYGQQVVAPKEGHIPGSVCIPVARHFNPDSTWKSATELRKMYQNFGVTPDKLVVSYCLNGAAAATNCFTLRHILGYPRASVYLASISGWCNDPRNLPLETYGNPRLLKEPEWVFYWGLKARPMMYDTYVRVVDARSNSEYEEGHIPYSINLPALDTLFCTDKAFTRVHEIKSILGNIGVSADCKVVIYDNNNGLQAAWLFWVLEYLGHKDVSILNGGFDRWKATGRKISNEPTPIAKAKPGNVFDISIHKTIFKAATQTHKLATRDWINGQTNNTDKLFLTSGSSTGTIEKVIPEVKNISWLNSVNEQGTFKTAAQLAGIYFDSGISPFKEIVCCSDIPMEAAHAYFTLKLLGYPRVRLCPGL